MTQTLNVFAWALALFASLVVALLAWQAGAVLVLAVLVAGAGLALKELSYAMFTVEEGTDDDDFPDTPTDSPS